MLLSYAYMRGARIKGGGDSYYHCISRVIDRKFALKRQEKDRLVELLVQVSTFCGVEVVTYVIIKITKVLRDRQTILLQL